MAAPASFLVRKKAFSLSFLFFIFYSSAAFVTAFHGFLICCFSPPTRRDRTKTLPPLPAGLYRPDQVERTAPPLHAQVPLFLKGLSLSCPNLKRDEERFSAKLPPPICLMHSTSIGLASSYAAAHTAPFNGVCIPFRRF